MNRMKVFSILLVIIFSIGLFGCEQEIKASPSTPPITKQPASPSIATPPVAEQLIKEPVTAQDYYTRAKTLSREGKWEATIADCKKAIELNPVYGEAYYLIGLASIGKKDYSVANESFAMATEVGEIPKAEMNDLREIANLVIPPGKLVILDMQYSAEKGHCAPGSPFNVPVGLTLFVNPKVSIEVSNLYCSPGIGNQYANKVSRYFSSFGYQFLMVSLNSYSPPSSVSCFVTYREKEDPNYTESNSIHNTKR